MARRCSGGIWVRSLSLEAHDIERKFAYEFLAHRFFIEHPRSSRRLRHEMVGMIENAEIDGERPL